MNIYDIIFYLFAAVTLLSGFFVVTVKNIVRAAFFLLFTFFGVAGLYVLLGADFISIVQIMVYVGGILILLLFGVMLTNKITDVDIKTGTVKIIPSMIVMILFAAGILYVVFNSNWITSNGEVPLTTTGILGDLLISNYVLIFELLGIILLIALIGAATLARKEKDLEV